MKRAILPMAALLAVALTAATAAEPPAPSPPLPAPTVFVHLSDLHFSVNVRKYWRQFGDREGDALLWASQVVPRLGAAAIVVTGDITDSKTARGEGLQQEAEWLAYAGLLRALNASGLPPSRVLDVPGNHDTFNLPARGAPNDFFSRHAAEGRRRASPRQRVFVHPLPRAGDAQDAAGDCPAAWLLGLDPTPDPGLRSPTNFAGLATAAFMEEAAAALHGLAAQRGQGCEAPLLAYCHYPLSTVDSTRRHGAGLLGALRHAAGPVRPMQGLTRLLAEHSVAAVLSGHLHSAFGQRLHRLHPTPAGGRLAELETAAWKDDRRFRLVGVDGASLSFLDLFFHTRSTPSMPGRPDAAAMRDPAWRAAYERRGWAVTALEPSAAVVDHAVLLTHPPDARYAPLGPSRAEGQPGAQAGEQAESGGEGWVRALVHSLEGQEEAAAAGNLSVELEGFLPGGGKLFTRPMQLQRAGGGDARGGGVSAPLLFAAAGDTTVSCVGVGGDPAGHCRPPAEHALIQVSARLGDGPVSRSPRTPVALRCAALTSSHQRCWVDAARGAPLPLRPSLPEWLGLAFNWPVLVHRIFLLVWATQAGGMLLLPRLLRRRLLPAIAAAPLLQCRPPQAPAALEPAGPPARRLARACVAHLLWPLAALVLCADATGVWTALMAHSLLLLLVPWLAYAALDGRPPALMFHYGVVGRLGVPGPADGPAAAAPWRFLGTPDTMFVSLAHSLFCLLPATLWVACVVARRTQLQPHSPPASRSASSDSNGGSNGGGGSAAARSLLGSGAPPVACGRWSFSGPQLAALGLLAWLNWAALYSRALAFMTPVSLLFSPGFAWTLPLALLLVTAWGGPRRRGPTPGKGE